MQASTKYTKAIHICIFLEANRDELVSSAKLANSLQTNPVVVRRLVKDLREGQIIESIAGPQGGFRLKKPASDISLWDIYLVMREEDFFQRPKVNPECVVSSNLKALVHDTFTDAERSMKSVLDEKSIENLSDELNKILHEA